MPCGNLLNVPDALTEKSKSFIKTIYTDNKYYVFELVNIGIHFYLNKQKMLTSSRLKNVKVRQFKDPVRTIFFYVIKTNRISLPGRI